MAPPISILGSRRGPAVPGGGGGGGGVPVNTGAPTISGTAQVGATLSGTDGTWTNSPTSFEYRWQRADNGSGLNTVDISGTTSVRVSQVADETRFIRRGVRGVNGAGAGAWAYSAWSGPVAAAPAGPAEDFASLPTTVTLTMDTGVTGGASELVTFGVPLPPGAVTNTNQIRVRQGGVEIPVAVAETMRWHWRDNSIRAVKIQCVRNMTGGDIVLTIDAAGRNTGTDLAMQPVMNGWMASGFVDDSGASLLKPRVQPLHDLAYVNRSGLFAPIATPPGSADVYDNWLNEIRLNSRLPPSGNGLPLWTESFPYALTTEEHWLYDRVKVLIMQACGTGTVSNRKMFLRHASISKFCYWRHIIPSGPQAGRWRHPLSNPDAPGWNVDFKYWYLEGYKLHLGLFGDDTQCTQAIADSMVANSKSISLSFYGSELENMLASAGAIWTERMQAAYLQQVTDCWELYNSAGLRAKIDAMVARMRLLQTTIQTWENFGVGTTKPGFWEHSVSGHESGGGNFFAALNAQATAGATSLTLKFFDPAVFNATIGVVADGMWIRTGAPLQFRTPAGTFVTRAIVTGTPTDNGNGTVTVPVQALAQTVPINTRVYIGYDGATTETSLREACGEQPLDRQASPWMTALLGGYFWNLYHTLAPGDSVRATCQSILYDLAWGVENHAFDSAWNGTTYVRRLSNASEYATTWMTTGDARNTYFMSQYMSLTSLVYSNLDSTNPDAHGTDVTGILAYGRFFETDAAKKAQLDARRAACEATHWSALNIARFYGEGYIRTVAWRDRDSPFRTWQYVLARNP